jgi:hypothetical protein
MFMVKKYYPTAPTRSSQFHGRMLPFGGIAPPRAVCGMIDCVNDKEDKSKGFAQWNESV